MIYSPQITKLFGVQSDTARKLVIEVVWYGPTGATISEDQHATVQVIVRDSIDDKYVFGRSLMPPVGLAWSDGTLRREEQDTDGVSSILKTVFMLKATPEIRWRVADALSETTVTPVTTQFIAPGYDSPSDMLDEVLKELTSSGSSTVYLQHAVGDYNLSITAMFCFSFELYRGLMLRGPVVSSGDDDNHLILTNAPRRVTTLFGTTENAFIKFVNSSFTEKTGVSDDIYDSEWAHSGNAESSVANSRVVCLGVTGSENEIDTSESNRFRRYTRTSLPQTAYRATGLNTPNIPSNPEETRSYPGTRWGSGIIDDLNDAGPLGRRRRTSYSKISSSDPEHSEVVTNLADVEYLGGMAQLHLQELAREYEVFDATVWYDRYAERDLSLVLRCQPQNLHYLENAAMALGCRSWIAQINELMPTLVINMTGLGQLAASLKTVTRSEHHASSSDALDADFAHISITAGVYVSSGTPAGWYEPEQSPTPTIESNTIIATSGDAYYEDVSHGDDTDLTNFQYDQWWVNFTGEHGAWGAIRGQDKVLSTSTWAGSDFPYWGVLPVRQSDLTVDANGVVSLSKLDDYLATLQLSASGWWVPATNGQNAVPLPGQATFIVGADENDGLYLSPRLWRGLDTSTWGDDDYSGYLLGRAYS